MMSLAPPFYSYDGVPVFCDAQDPLQYYYFPNRPHFATDEHNRPAVRFVALKADPDQPSPDAEQVTGFLYFDTALDWPTETLTHVAQKIQQDRDLDQPPRLVPLLYRSGTVRLMFLDQMSPDPTSAGGAPPTDAAAGSPPDGSPSAGKWVTLLETSNTPSLYGENRAIFGVELSKKATELLYAAFDGFVPAGVVYDLTFDAMQPAFHIHLTANWHLAYDYIKEKHTVDSIFFSSDVEKTVSDLVDNKVIQLDAAVEGVGEEGLTGQFNEVKNRLLDFVLDTFFKAVPNPYKPDDTSIQDGIVGTLRDLRQFGSPFSVGYQRIEVTADQLATLNVDYNVSTAVQRHIAPQAHLNLCFADYNLKKDDVVTVVDERDSIFREAEFQLMVSADFKTDAIEAVTVDIAYGEPSPPPSNADLWSFLVKDSSVVRKTGWYDPAVGDQVQYRYEAVFASAGAAGPELQLQSDWQASTGTIVVVTPDELYRRRSIEVQIDDGFPFDAYPGVEVQLRYTEPTSGWTHTDSAVLDAKTRTWNPVFRIHRDWSEATDYKLTYFHQAGNLESDWQTTSGSRIDIGDPRTNLFVVHVIVGGDTSQLNQIVVDLHYEDPENNIFESGSFTLDKTNFTAKHDWAFPRADPARDHYTCSQVIVDAAGDVTVTGEVESNSPFLIVGPAYAKRWIVQPQLIGPPLTENGIDKVTVELHYEDSANSYASDKKVVFTAPGDGDQWRLDLRDAAARQYRYTVTYESSNGFDHVLGPLQSTDTFLIVPSVPPGS
jgi:hypothetical protein